MPNTAFDLKLTTNDGCSFQPYKWTVSVVEPFLVNMALLQIFSILDLLIQTWKQQDLRKLKTTLIVPFLFTWNLLWCTMINITIHCINHSIKPFFMMWIYDDITKNLSHNSRVVSIHLHTHTLDSSVRSTWSADFN